MSRKVFTAGEVLAAADVNSFLMDQSVMSFAGTAARGSAIASPVEGMTTYLEDTDDLQIWSGSSWVSPFGLTLINTTNFTAQTSVTVNNVFSAAYDNYVVEIYGTQNTSASDSFYTLVNGSTPAASNWGFNRLIMYASGTNGFSGANAQANPGTFPVNAGTTFAITLNLKSPFLTNRTYGFTEYITSASGAGVNTAVWQHDTLNNATSYEGFRYSTSAGTITGTIRVYGVRR
jgi:hypothetical protein